MSEEDLGQCTFPCIDVCTRKGCPHKKKPPPQAPPPYGLLLGAGLAASALAPNVLPRPPVTPAPPSSVISRPSSVNPSSNSLSEYLDICLEEGWKSLLPVSSWEDIPLYIFPELDYEIPRYIQEENPIVFMYFFIDASRNCDISFFLELSDPDSGRINAYFDVVAETGGLVETQPDYGAQIAERLTQFGYSELPTSNPSIRKYVFPRFLKEFSSVIEEEYGELVFLQGSNIAVMQSPSSASPILIYIDDTIILRFNDAAFYGFTQEQKAIMKTSFGYVPVILLDGTTGFVSSQFAYPANDVRLIVKEFNRTWSYEFIDSTRSSYVNGG